MSICLLQTTYSLISWYL